MLTYEEAKRIGIDACVKKIGETFLTEHQDNSVYSCGDAEDYAFCYVGVSDLPPRKQKDGTLTLTSGPENRFPFGAACNVAYDTGEITFLECVLPDARA